MNYMDYSAESHIKIISSMYRDSDSDEAKQDYINYIKFVIDLRPKDEQGLLKKMWEWEME